MNKTENTQLESTIENETNRVETFYRYISEDEKARLAIESLLDRSCEKSYLNKQSTLKKKPGASAYTIDDASLKAIKLQEKLQKAAKQSEHLDKVLNTVKSLRAKRMHFNPLVRALSSGAATGSYVFGYGFIYGSGYTGDSENSVTAPGFELAHGSYIFDAIKKIEPLIREMSIQELYKKIFNLNE